MITRTIAVSKDDRRFLLGVVRREMRRKRESIERARQKSGQADASWHEFLTKANEKLVFLAALEAKIRGGETDA